VCPGRDKEISFFGRGRERGNIVFVLIYRSWYKRVQSWRGFTILLEANTTSSFTLSEN
jgi:hypothetical protein